MKSGTRLSIWATEKSSGQSHLQPQPVRMDPDEQHHPLRALPTTSSPVVGSTALPRTADAHNSSANGSAPLSGLAACPNANAFFWPSCISLSEATITILVLLGVMLVIVLGNLMVVLTVANDNKLRAQRQNWLLVSLAMADLLVGMLVMPLTLIYEIVGVWVLGSVLCELWLALDVLFVTASILHICIISLDRYWSVTQPLTYPAKRTPRRIWVMIGVAWLVSFLICFPPLLGWRPKRRPGECSVSNELDYVLYSSLGSFYIPVAILVMVYWRIYEITKRHSQQRLKDTQRMGQTLCQLSSTTIGAGQKLAESGMSSTKGQKQRQHISNRSPDEVSSADISIRPPTGREEEEIRLEGGVQTPGGMEQSNSLDSGITTMALDEEGAMNNAKRCHKKATANGTEAKKTNYGILRPAFLTHLFRKNCASDSCSESVISRNRSLEKRRRRLKAKERQATLLLGFILFAFIASWMPFFIMYVLNALKIHAPVMVFKFFFWLGYCNSAVNPIIYTFYNREFRRALLRVIRRNQNRLHCLQRFAADY